MRVLDPGRRIYWCYRYRLNGRERGMSLGSDPEFSLAEARRKVTIDKVDPVAQKRNAPAKADGQTFDAVAHQYLQRQEERGPLGKNPKHRRNGARR